MAASKLTLDATIQIKLGSCATDLIENQFKLGGKMPGPLCLNRLLINLVARRLSLNWTAASNVNLDAAIQSSFAGSTDVQKLTQAVLDKALKYSWSISQAKWHHYIFKKSPGSLEGGFPFMTRGHM
jgi:hypothetical protein